MKRGTTLFLKIAIILIGIPVFALCIFLFPNTVIVAIEQAKKGAVLAYVVFGLLFIMYSSTVPFYLALYQALKLLNYIDKNLAFSDLSVIALKKIRNYAALISGLYVIALPLVYVIAEWDDAPGLILIGMVIVGASAVIAVFSAVLKMLLKEAIDLKSDNDLTI